MRPTVRAIVTVFGALLALLAVTVAAAFVDLGMWNAPVAFSIAAAKAALVVLVFMEVRYSSAQVKIFACCGVFWLFILLAGVLQDYLTRHVIPYP